MNNSLTIEAFGEAKNLRQWARDPRCAVSQALLSERLNTGWEPEPAITTPPAPKRNCGVLLTAFGETKTQNEWARDPRSPVTEGGICGRLKRGWSPEAAITTPSRRDLAGIRRLRALGFRDYADCNERIGICCSAGTFYRRLKAGWTLEDACILPTLHRGRAVWGEKP